MRQDGGLRDGAVRARRFGHRVGLYTLAEAANLAGLSYPTAYAWARDGIAPVQAGPRGIATRTITPEDVFRLAVLRELRSRVHTHKRRRTIRALRRASEVLGSHPPKDGFLVVGGDLCCVYTKDADLTFAFFMDKAASFTVINLARVWETLPGLEPRP